MLWVRGSGHQVEGGRFALFLQPWPSFEMLEGRLAVRVAGNRPMPAFTPWRRPAISTLPARRHRPAPREGGQHLKGPIYIFYTLYILYTLYTLYIFYILLLTKFMFLNK